MFQEKTHYERVMTIAREASSFTWMVKEIKEKLPDDLQYYHFAVDVLEPLINDRERLSRHPLLLTAAVMDRDNPGWLSTHIQMEYLMLQFIRSGKQVFRLMPGLAKMLDETDIEAPAPLVKLPYRAFYMEVPHSLFTIWNNVSGEHRVEGIYICEDDWADEIKFIESGRRHIDNEGIREFLPELNRVIRVLVVGRPIGTEQYVPGIENELYSTSDLNSETERSAATSK